MKLFMVSYDLVNPGRDYNKLIDKLKSMGAQKVLLSQWVLLSNLSAQQIRDTLQQFIDTNDRVVVIEFTDRDWATYNAMTKLNDVKAPLPSFSSLTYR
jgi:CRISPR-associated endonuclease Cas2